MFTFFKAVRKPLKDSSSKIGSESSSHSGSSPELSGKSSSRSAIKKRRGKASLPSSPSASSIENPYARSNASNFGESGYGRRSANKSPASQLYGKGGNPFDDSDKD